MTLDEREGNSLINVAVVGCGYWGINYVRVFSELPNAKFALVCDTREERLRTLRDRYQLITTTNKLDEVLANKWVDAVVVCTPATTHFDIAKQCLQAGKHVLVEKPLTTNVNHGQELIETAEKLGLVLMVGHTFLYNAGIQKVKELVQNKDFGKLYYLHATRTNMGPVRDDVNVFWDLASHDVAIFNYLLDGQPQWVSAVGSGVLGNERVDVGFATLNYKDSVIANTHSSWICPNKVRDVVVVASGCRIFFNDLNNVESVRVYQKGIAAGPPEPGTYGEFRLTVRDGDIVSPHVTTSEPLKNMCMHFLECIANNQKPISDGTNGLAVVRVIASIDKSLSENGSPVQVV